MRTLLFFVSYCFALSVGFGQQLTLSHPLDGAVYQRDDNGSGTIRIGGTYNSARFKQDNGTRLVRARLVQLEVSSGAVKQGGNTYPVSVQRNFSGTSFSGTITVPAGWYRLEVEAIRRYRDPDPNIPPTFIEEVIQSTSTKVGVGEVFIIGGQSNAQGLPNSAGDLNVAQSNLDYDGVRTQPVNVGVGANLPRTFYERVTASSLDQIKAEYVQNTLRAAQTPTNQGIAPTGNSLWYWSYVGQKLAQQYDVPIAFYNVAWGGTHIKAWEGSKDNVSTPAGDPRGGPSNFYGAGAPYRILRAALRLYGSIYGVRSVLWLQGETDAKAVNEVQSWGTRGVDSSDDYKNRLQQVIAQTRTDFGPVAWVVGQTSIIGGGPNNNPPPVTNGSLISNSIASGQSLAVTTAPSNPALQVSVTGSSVGPQVFLGPDMNNAVTVRRTSNGNDDEPVHFRRFDSSDNVDGLLQAGEAWSNAIKGILNSQAADRIRPVTQARAGTEFQTLSINETTNTISAPSGYSVMWVADNNGTFDLSSPVSSGQSISTSGSGRLRAVLTNGTGNRIITQAVNLPYTLIDDTNDPGTPPSGSQCKNGNESSGGNRTPNGAIVGGFGNNTEFMEYTFTGQTAGSTTFTIRYASGDQQAGIDLVVNGTPYSMRPAGTGSWTPSTEATITINLNANTNIIRIQGSEQGNFTYDRICLGSGTGGGTPGCAFSIAPTVSNGNPGCNASLTLFANCSGADCGGVSYSWSGNGQSYSGPTPGITGPGSNGTFTYSVTASKSGCGNQTGSVNVTVTGCGGTGLNISSASLNCSTGVVTLNLTGQNGNPVEYKAPGLQDWSTNQLVVPSWQRNGTQFTFWVRQSGNNEASITYTTNCGSGRIAAPLSTEPDSGLWVSPNPTSGKVTARFTLGEKEQATLSVVNMAGQSVQTREVRGIGQQQEETLDLSGQASGLYVVRLQTAIGTRTAKVMVQR